MNIYIYRGVGGGFLYRLIVEIRRLETCCRRKASMLLNIYQN